MPSSRRPTVAIVDDDPQLRQLFSEVLSDEYRVLEADSGWAALDVMDDDVDAVLLDRRMPGLAGGLALLVWYLAPAALVHVGRTRRLRAAFDWDDVWGLATADANGSAWLLALAVSAAAGVVLTVLDAAAIGVTSAGSSPSTSSWRWRICTRRGPRRSGSTARFRLRTGAKTEMEMHSERFHCRKMFHMNRFCREIISSGVPS